MTGPAIKKPLLTEAVCSKAPSSLTSALLAEPSEDEANARHLDAIHHGSSLVLARLPHKPEVRECCLGLTASL